MFEEEEGVPLTPKMKKFIIAAMVFGFLMGISELSRDRGYKRSIPEPLHRLVVEKGALVTFIIRDGVLKDSCVMPYQGWFKGVEQGNTLKYIYELQGTWYPSDEADEKRSGEDESACWPGDQFKTNFNIDSPNNYRVIYSDLYRYGPP